MKKIYVNDKCLQLTDYNTRVKTSPHIISTSYAGHQSIVHILSTLNQSKQYKSAEIFHPNLDELWDDFQAYFEPINAAGGVVLDEHHRLLVIYRHGKWDLPKGKVENNESYEHAAIREVQEECGLAQCSIIKPLSSTYHTYLLNKVQVLKRTLWYTMRSSSAQELTPQTEEGITQLKWIQRSELPEVYKNTFASIADLLKTEEKLIFEN